MTQEQTFFYLFSEDNDKGIEILELTTVEALEMCGNGGATGWICRNRHYRKPSISRFSCLRAVGDENNRYPQRSLK